MTAVTRESHRAPGRRDTVFRMQALEHAVDAHRSGIGDYLDEEADHDVADYLMPVRVHELATTEQYLAAGHATPR
jgi:hypothetical protein